VSMFDSSVPFRSDHDLRPSDLKGSGRTGLTRTALVKSPIWCVGSGSDGKDQIEEEFTCV
jgi:hypothetical protein